ncbi:F-box protein At4g22390-like [Silene latifolia]|uniref:F-box protein At4g22390-like n=1 Tax=Silene latifolia TaxID=37657 RepID=UPI003D772922
MVASCESYLLIGCGFTDLEGLILLNPTTRIYRVLPKVYVPTDHDYCQYGMCHCLDDEFNDDFKVVRIVQCDKWVNEVVVTVRQVIIYSLKTNSWKPIECEPTTSEWCDTPVLVQNHLLVMLCYGSGRMTRIGCFDIKAERWSNDVLLPDIPLCEIESNPTPQWSADRYQYHLGVLDGRLRFTYYDVNKSSYSVWVMKEFGVKESWVKLMSPLVHGSERAVYHPIAYRKGSSHELLCVPNYSRKYMWYNLRDKQFTETGFNGNGLIRTNSSFVYICKGSLINFPGGLLIRSSSNEREMDNDNDDDNDSDVYNDGYLYNEGEWLHF